MTADGRSWHCWSVYGGFAGITDGVGKAWISSLAPPEVRGHAQGLFQGLAGVGILVAGLWAGLLWTAGPGSGVVPLLVSGTVAAGCARRPVALRAPARLRRGGCPRDHIPPDECREHPVGVVLGRPEPQVRPGDRPRREVQLRTLADRDDRPAEPLNVGDHGLSLGQVRRAGHVEHEPTGTHHLEGAGQQPTLQGRQLGEVTGRPAPPRLRPPAQGTQTRAGRIEQHPVVAGADVVGRGVGHQHLVPATDGPQRCRTRSRAVGVQLDGGQGAAPLCRLTGEQRRLAARPGAHVQPARVGTVECRVSQHQRHHLAALVLDAGRAGGHLGDRAGLTASTRTASRDSWPGRAATPCSASLSISSARSVVRGDQRHRTCRVVRQQLGGGVGPGALGLRGRQRIVDPADDPRRMRRGH